MTSLQPKTIIIVEDETDTAEMLAEMIRLCGYQVLKSFGGMPAISLIEQEKPDVILMDIMMPDVSGLDVIKHVQRDPSLANIPIVIVSARCMPADIRTGLDAGALAYLTKPVSYSDLKEAVDHAIQSTNRT